MKSKRIFILLSVVLLMSMSAGCGNDLYTLDWTGMGLDSSVSGSAEKKQPETAELGSKPEETTSDYELSAGEEETSEEESGERLDDRENVLQDDEAPVPENEDDDAAAPEQAVYSYTDMTAVMYASVGVNVRDMPSVDGQKIGELSVGQEAAVTGQCNETSWYRVDYNGQIGYICNSYLVTEKPVVEVAESPQQPEATEAAQPEIQNGLVTINYLANKKSLKERCTDEEFQAAYDAAVQIVTPLIGLSREDQLYGIAKALRIMFDSGQVSYSVDAPHYSDPYGYFVLGVGSCAGCARATGLCLNMLGIPYEHVNENQWTHQWCRVEIDGTYWICDAYGLYVGPEPAPYTHPIF